MNWIERMYELKGRDLYSQNGESLILEYVYHCIPYKTTRPSIYDIGAGDGFHLSNSRHLSLNCGWFSLKRDIEDRVTVDNCIDKDFSPTVISIDIDGNDYWILDKQIPHYEPKIIIAEFNASYTDSRTIAYNPNHEWSGDSYYGFTFDAGVKLAEKHGYKVIFQIADMNMIMVRKDLIEGLYVPPVTFKQSTFFKMSDRTDWVMI